MANNDTLTVVISRIDNIDERLMKVFTENQNLKALTIVVPENNAGKDVYAIENHEVKYSNPLVYLTKEIKTIPNSIGDLVSLEYLNVSSLGLHELPTDIVLLKKLKVLDLSRNRLDFKSELGKLEKLPNLQVLKLYGNQLSEEILNELLKLNIEKIHFKEEDFIKEDRSEYMNLVKKNLTESVGERLEKIYTRISTYFPEAKGFTNVDESNHAEIRKLTEEKIKGLQNGEYVEWASFISYLNERFGYHIIDNSYNQGPYLDVILPIDSTIEPSIDTKKFLIVTVSLLENVFTVYYSLNINFKIFDRKDMPVKRNIWYGLEYANTQDSMLLNEVISLLNDHYKKHVFYSHKDLIDFKVKDRVPYGTINEIGDTYSLFDFLFSEAVPKPSEILE